MTTITKQFYQAINADNYPKAFELIADLPQDEQETMLTAVMKFLKHDFDLASKPQSMVVLRRKLKPGKTYQDFHNAWLPPVDARDSLSGEKQYDYFDGPVRVINGIDSKEPNCFSTVLLSTASMDVLGTEYAKYAKTEAKRHEALKNIVEHVDKAYMCGVKDSNYFG